MSGISNKILLSAKTVSASLKNSVVSLLIILLLSLPGTVLSQVITNNNAAIRILTGTHVGAGDAVNNSGIVSNDGYLKLSGNYSSTGNTNGNGIYTLGGSWANTGGIFDPGTSTVIFNGPGDQHITRTGGETFFNLTVDNAGAPLFKRLAIQNNVTILGTLTMSLGNMDAGTYLLYLSNPLAASLNYTSTTKSRIFGKFERGISETADYLFPLGTASFYNPLNLKTNILSTGGSVLSQYFAVDPGNAGLPLPDPPVEIFDRYPDGYWSLAAHGGFSVSDFNISLNAEGFVDTIRDVTRVIKRTGEGSWLTDGIHRDASDNIVYRDNLSGDISSSGTQFALGRIRPLIITHPHDTTACESTNPSFEIIASGAEKLKFTWYKEPGILIENGPHYQGARTSVLTIINTVLSDAGEYYCIVTDRYRNSIRSNNATLTVMKIPEAKVTPNDQPHECSDIAFEDIVLDLTYWDPGTSFIWSRNTPDGIVTTIPESGSANTIGDVLGGSFINTSDEPIKITFIITPVGPEPTKCVGEPVEASVTVNPTPIAIELNARPTICNGDPISIKLISPTIMTTGNVVFDYTVTFEGQPGQIVGDTVPGTLVSGDILNYRFENKSDTILSVFYTVTPKNYSLGCKYDSIIVPEVKVHPKPLQDLSISTPFTCAGGSDGVLKAVLSKGSKPDILTWIERPWAGDTTYSTSLNTDYLTVRYAGEYNLTVEDSFGCSNSITHLEVLGTTFRTNMYVDKTSGFGTSCPGTADGKIWIWESSASAKPPLEYWLVHNEKDTIRYNTISYIGEIKYENNLPAGAYRLIIKDANGCYNLSPPQDIINEPPSINVTLGVSDFSGYNITCKGYNDGSIWTTMVSGGNGGPFSFLWETDGGNIPGQANGDRLDNIPAGIYYLNTTDTKGCVRRDTIIIDEPDGMILDSFKLSLSSDEINNISCSSGNDGYIYLSVSGGAKPYNYFWTDSVSYTAITEDIENLGEGTYVCKVTDRNGCELKLPPLSQYPAFTLSAPDPLLFNATTSTSADGSFNISCNGETGWINLNVTGGAEPYEYTWTTDNGSEPEPGQPDQLSLRAGTYHIHLRDANMCEKDTVITLKQPDPLTSTLTPSHITCYPAGFSNGSIDLTASGGIAPYCNWKWSNGALTEDIDGLTAGSYKVTFTDANNCHHSDSVRINLPAPITYNAVISDYNGFNVTCNGKSDGWININMENGLAPYVYEWQKTEGDFSVTGNSLTNLNSGHYILTITDANMCTETDTIEIREPGLLGINIIKSYSDFGEYNINCAGKSTGTVEIEPLNYAGAVTYLWSDGANTGVRTNIPAGDYHVYVEDGNGCSIDSLFILTEPDSLKLSFEVAPPWCPDKPDGEISVTASGGVPGSDYSYRWSDGSSGHNITGIVEGLYVVTVTDLNGCTIRDSVLVRPQNENCLIIPNVFSPNGDLINDEWNIGLIELYPQVEIKIFNRWGGNVWKSERGYPHPWDGRSNGSPLPVDSYHYIIELGPNRRPVIGNVTIVR